MSQNSIDSVVAEYLAECEELTQRVGNNLRNLQKSPASAEILDSIYRDIHTVKGSAQLFGYSTIGNIGHAMESSFEPIRDQGRTPTGKHFESLFLCLDVVEQAMIAIRTGEEASLAPLAASVIGILEASCAAASAELIPEAAPLPFFGEEETPSFLTPASIPQSMMEEVPAPTMKAALPEMAPEAHSAEAATKAALTESGQKPSAESDSSNSIRVPVALLDKLMILMGEMVLVRNQVLQYANRTDDLEFLNLSQRLDVVTSEIQGEVMKTRMQPIGTVLSKFHRVVRDLSRDLGKKIELQLSGMETELDKTLLEAVKDPIMHIVRNSCDHGMESPEERKSAGKSELGIISVRSFHEGGLVIVEISDDGRGLNRQKICDKAVEKGILSADRAAALSEREAQSLIFAPGFSTAAKVTNVSGRGVGMDVVKSNIEGIGGIVDLTSKFGHGTTIRLKIPLTLAIVPAMIVRCRDERFAIPQVKLVELVRVEKNSTTNPIEYLQGQPVYRLRGNLLPLLTLEDVLQMPTDANRIPEEAANIAVLNAEGKLFGLIVDEVQDTAEVVVKPLSAFLKSLPIYSGATVLGDGSVALILDVMGVAQQHNLLSDSPAKTVSSDSHRNSAAEMQEFLLFRLGSPTKHAIPLNLVHRLEEIPSKALELSGAQKVIRYRESVLPIVTLNDVLGLTNPNNPPEQSDTMAVIVLQKAGKFFGIQVDEILDVLSTESPMDDSLCDRPGLLGNLVTPEGIVVIVDALQILDSFMKKNHAANGVAQKPEAKETNLRILFVEDTAFFRKHVNTVLTRAGFQVTTANDGQAGLELLENSRPGSFDLVLSDIEMPRMNGIELVKAVRANKDWNVVPMLALTTKFSAEHAEAGRKAGFDAYLEKLNPEVLLKAIDTVMAKTRKAA
jgi:two-component system chemotaxis sensor kinase CheA